MGGALPALRIATTFVVSRRVDAPALFAVSLLVAGTVVGLLTADPRLMARESYLTAVVGVWILASLFLSRPVVFTATAELMPPDQLEDWNRSWDTNVRFRTTLRVMTAAFGSAFLIDAAARVIMAYTVPLDLVPILSALLLLIMLASIVVAGRIYATGHLGETPQPLRE